MRSAPELVAEHLPMVRRVARRVHASIRGAVELDELVSMGVVGLLDAASRADPNARTFGRYAQLRIRGAILDGLGNTAPLPRKWHRLVRAGRLRAYPRVTAPRMLERLGAPVWTPTDRIDRQRAIRAMLRLPPRLCALLHAYFFHDMSLTDIAGRLELSISRVSRLRDRGIGALRDALRDAERASSPVSSRPMAGCAITPRRP